MESGLGVVLAAGGEDYPVAAKAEQLQQTLGSLLRFTRAKRSQLLFLDDTSKGLKGVTDEERKGTTV